MGEAGVALGHRLLPHAENPLGFRHVTRPAVLLFRLRHRGVRSRDRYADRRDARVCAPSFCRIAGNRSIPRSISARSKARSCRAWAGSPARNCGGTSTGRLRTHGPSTYKIPGSRDVPPVFNARILADAPNREETVFRSKAVGEPPLMLAISVWLAIRDAIASVADHKRAPHLDAPATPERVLHGGGCDQRQMIMLRFLLTLLACAALRHARFRAKRTRQAGLDQRRRPLGSGDLDPRQTCASLHAVARPQCAGGNKLRLPDRPRRNSARRHEQELCLHVRGAGAGDAGAAIRRRADAHGATCLQHPRQYRIAETLLDALQRSEHADVQIGSTKVRLPFDDFNAARVVLEVCVQKLGTKQ